MRMKKYTLWLVCLLFALALSLCLTGCDRVLTEVGSKTEEETKTEAETEPKEETEGGHTHLFSEWEVTQDATCTVAGRQERACLECGFAEYSLIPTAGHLEVIEPAVAPTCTKDGKTMQSCCSVCGTVLTASTVLHATGHVAVSIPALSPTCTSSGREEGSRCEICSVVLKGGETLPQTGHTPVTDEAVEPTCSSPGKTEGSHCSVCRATLVAQAVVPVVGHTYDNGEIVTRATCVAEGVRKFTCTVAGCGHSYTEAYALPAIEGTELYREAVKYVGEITVYDRSGVAVGLATGFVFSSDGKIITNFHVIDGAYSATITIGEDTYSIEQVLAYDATIDLAVLKVNATGLTAATVCMSPVQTGETVYAIGSSRGLTNTYSKGIVTCAAREVDGVVHVQHDASITHGNSGGPLLNVYGEVIGINTWGLNDSQNLNFAVFTGELDNLTYGTPIALSDFYEQNLTSYDILLDWVLENSNAAVGDEIRYDDLREDTWYSMAYSSSANALYLFVAWEFNDGATLELLIDLSSGPESYLYYAAYALGGKQNQISGYITAATFTDGTPLSYDSYKGAYWSESELLERYRLVTVDLLAWYEATAAQNSIGVDLEDLGFAVFEADSN